MRSLPSLLVLLALAACGREAAEPAPPALPAVAPAPPATPTFVGRWAATPELCRDGAWMFRPDGVSTAGEVSCQFGTVEADTAAYRIEASCTAEGTASEREIRLTVTDPAPPESMTVTGGPWDGPITLRRCPAA